MNDAGKSGVAWRRGMAAWHADFRDGRVVWRADSREEVRCGVLTSGREERYPGRKSGSIEC